MFIIEHRVDRRLFIGRFVCVHVQTLAVADCEQWFSEKTHFRSVKNRESNLFLILTPHEYVNAKYKCPTSGNLKMTYRQNSDAAFNLIH